MAKIHDKYIVELKEVIKGYGNDSTEKDPFNLPCDYKFYEIDGIAICEESFRKMKPLSSIKENIKAEIEKEIDRLWDTFGEHISKQEIFYIIDKHMEGENKNG